MEGRLTGLDALRGIAALIVLGYHVTIFFNLPAPPKAYVAVDFFFVLSGYIMERTYDVRALGPFKFFWKRYKRFWPVMAAGMALGLMGWLAAPYGKPTPVAIASGFLLIPALAGWAFAFNIPAWSLALELTANFVHGLRLNALVVCVASAAIYLLIVIRLGADPGPKSYLLGIPRVLAGYYLGVLLYRRWKDDPPKVGSYGFAALAFILLPLPPWADLAFVFVGCPVLIAAGIRTPVRWGSVAGKISFPLYAWHFPIVRAVAQLSR